MKGRITVHSPILAHHRRTRSLPAQSRSSSPGAEHREDPLDKDFLRELRTFKSSESRFPQLTHPIYAVLLVLVLFIHFFFPQFHLPSASVPLRSPPAASPPAYCPPHPANPFLDPLICPQSSIEQSGTLYNTAPRNMGLAQEASRVAQEFEYTSDDVNKGVKEFIREMSMQHAIE